MILLTDSISGRGLLLSKSSIVCIEDVGAYRFVTYTIGRGTTTVAVKEDIETLSERLKESV